MECATIAGSFVYRHIRLHLSIEILISMRILSGWYALGQAVDDTIVKGYEKLARSVVKRPFIWIVCMSCIATICCIGLTKMKVIISTDKMWIPDDAETVDTQDFIETNFGPKPRGGPVLFTATQSIDNNVINLDAFETLWDVHEKIVSETQGNGYNYTQLCANHDPQGRCMVYGVLQFFNGDRSYYNTVVANNQTNLISRISAASFPDGTGVLRDQLFGNCTFNPVNKFILACEGVIQFYRIKHYPLETAVDWERSMTKVVDGMSTDNVNVYRNANSAYDDELAKSAAPDMPLMTVMYALVIVMVFFTLTKSFNFAGPRLGLSITGLLLIALAIMAGFGICSGLGISSTSINIILPFIIVGMGVNDLYIITGAFDAQDPSLSVEDRMAGAMRRCGKSIGYTAVTSASAFFLGGLSKFFALRHLCYYAGACVLCNWVLQVTFYCAVLSLDAKRRDWNKLDLLCCFTSPRAQQTVQPFEVVKEGEDQADSAIPSNSSAAEVDPAIAKYAAKEDTSTQDSPDKADLQQNQATAALTRRRNPKDMNYLEYFFSELYSPFLAHPLARLFLVAGCGGLLVANIFGVYKVHQGFEASELLDRDSFVRDFMLAARPLKLLAAEQSAPVEIIFQEMYYHNQTVQEEILRLQGDFLNNTAYNKGPMISWVTAFNKFVRTPSPRPPPFPQNPFIPHLNDDGYLTDEFWYYKALQRFLVVAPRFRADIHLVNTTEGSISPVKIHMCRITAFHNNITGPINAVNSMKHARDLMETALLEPKPMVFSPSYPRSEGYVISVEQSISLMVLGLIAVAGVTFLVVMPHRLSTVAVAVVAVAMTYVDFIGNMPRWGMVVQINLVTITIIVLSTGLIADYVLHVLHHYQAQAHTVPPLERMKSALVDIGPSILMGCLTMLVAIVPTAFGRSFIFKMFFRMFFCIIGYSLCHALVLLPALLPTVSFLMCETCMPGAQGASRGEGDGESGLELRAKPTSAPSVVKVEAADGGGQADEVVPFAEA